MHLKELIRSTNYLLIVLAGDWQCWVEKDSEEEIGCVIWHFDKLNYSFFKWESPMPFIRIDFFK